MKPLPDIADDFPIWRTATTLAMSRRVDHRIYELGLARSLLDFLNGNNLLVSPIYADGDDELAEFILRWGDLTEEGKHFYVNAEQKWLGSTDRSQDPTDIRVLERELAKLRNKK